MSYAISLRTEIQKTKRSAALWICVLGSGFIPVIFVLMYTLNSKEFTKQLKETPWEEHFAMGWQVFSAFLLPVFVILVCSMIVQIEYKNNTWKQVFSSPQSIGNIFLSKYSTILLMVLLLFVLFNFFMFGAAVLANLIHREYTFFDKGMDMNDLLKTNLKFFISLLAIISIQYWLSLRIKNFIVPIGIGLALLIACIIIQPWEHIYKVPYAMPFITFISIDRGVLKTGTLLQNHELNSLGYFAFFTLLAFLDMRYRKERG